ncbi:MAG: glycosyltransferase family 2 protein [Nitrospirae bacterium]|nr:glycosyltransferase family 2 protein [Nitrospirota bacterium]
MEEKRKKVSVVIPVFNEEAVLQTLYDRLAKVAEARHEEFEFIFVNDGSTDGSLNKLIELNSQDKRVCIIDLARNFSHQNALTAGIDEADGDAVILMDADLEDQPEDILKFLDKWNEGYQVVYAVRRSRKVSLLKSLIFKMFHMLNKKISNIDMQIAGIFGLMDHVVVEQMKRISEHNRYIPGLRNWIGFNQTGVEVDRGARYDAKPRMTLYRLYRLAFDSFTSFSDVLLSLPLHLGIILSALSLLSIVIIFIFKVFFDIGPWGWPSLVSIILLLAGLQFFFIGLIGEFISRIFFEVKKRPLYIIKRKYR